MAAFVGYELGWRLQEVLGPTWAHVNLETGELRLDPGATKNKDARAVYVSPRAQAGAHRAAGAGEGPGPGA